MKPQLLAPAGDFTMLRTAIDSGADAVYFGVKELNMREAGSTNFSLEELGEITRLCKENNVKTCLTVNTIIYDGEEEFVDKILVAAKKAGVDAIIAWDLMVLEKAAEQGLETHLSTQASAANFHALKSYHEKYGVKRFVLARELDLEQIKSIKEKIVEENLGVEIECFVHGAMCIAISGRCFMSLAANCRSANRGKCIQVCRRQYKVIDIEEGTEMILDNNFVMSPKDLCTMPIIDKLIEADIDVFKIEGRARSPEYVKTVVSAYRKAIDAYEQGELTDELKTQLLKKMEEVYNRGFETGFYMGKPLNAWAGSYGSKATTRKIYLGTLSNYYTKPGIAEVKLESDTIAEGDQYYIIGKKTGVVKEEMPEFMVDDQFVDLAEKGDIVTFKAPKAREGDKFYKVVKTTKEMEQ